MVFIKILTALSYLTPYRTFLKGNIYHPITIGNNVWIGEGVKILPGVNIGSGSIIGAGSVVKKYSKKYNMLVFQLNH